ncbi:Membrane protein involved in the export of O-antigen and teichoic acid [Clostridium sp. USBA 49]|uniref:hypothetical protein n=1 Tax=Clostridium sp. USBA 49 TaxID=1881060 RepID=UPI00099B1EED|nr:hypothetical protein [Clostridium sp. USBA 49]SKA87494.1 Membrane protein involved in the export of O-antigen and teichoic acid [Clostridium sp. USBA 49]
MNNKFITFLKNLSYTLFSNLTSMIVSSVVVLIVPKLIGVKEYGYWQLYLFYSSYVGFLHFGWNDGIYLRYGGKDYNKLNKKVFFSQFWMLTIMQLIIGISIFIISNIYINDINKMFVFKMTALCLFLTNSRTMLLYILQATNRIKEYAQITLIEKIFYCILIIMFLMIGIREYKLMIVADLIGKLISLLFSIYCCKDIVIKNISFFYLNLKETIENINVGIKLMFANIASMLIVGIIRFGIEHTWDVATFGKVSLTLSISNLIMIFINAVGIIMFPIMKRTDEKKLSKIYLVINRFLMTFLFGILIVYYPLKMILSLWLPNYSESLKYMALVFPMCIYEGKMSLLINTYFKTLRKEKLMLFINIISVILSLMLTFIFTFVFKNLILSIVSIVILLAFRCILAEIFLFNILNISLSNDIIFETIMTIAFILTGWLTNSWIGPIIYLLIYIIYLFIKRKNIVYAFKTTKQLVKD